MYRSTSRVQIHIYNTFAHMIIFLGHSMNHASYLHTNILVHTNFVWKITKCWLWVWFVYKSTSRVRMHICNTFARMIIFLGHITIHASYLHEYLLVRTNFFGKEPDAGYKCDPCLNQPPKYKCIFAIHLHKWLYI